MSFQVHGKCGNRIAAASVLCLGLILALAVSTGMARATAPQATTAGPCTVLNGPICVGADSACQFNDLQDAIDSVSTSAGVSTTIHVANNQNYIGQHLTIVNRNITLSGGYASCVASSPTGTTTLNGLSTNSVIAIGANAGHRSIQLDHLKISGGGGNDPIGLHVYSVGGGVNIGGDVTVTIAESEISHNTATLGGGIALGGEDSPELTLINTQVSANSATNGVNGAAHLSGKGGGIYCRNESNFSDTGIVMEGGNILGNVAVADSNGTTRGGGVYLEACGFTGTGIEATLNIASGEGSAGGGFYAGAGSSFGSRLSLGGASTGPSLINANIAGGDGGGIWSMSTVILDSVAVQNNIAGFSGAGSGGGVYLSGSAALSMDSQACTGCSSLTGNSATDSGSAILGWAIHPPALTVAIANTRISGNGDAHSAAVIDLANEDTDPFLDNDVWLDMSNDLVIGNSATDAFAIVRSEPAGHVRITSSTFADNAVGALFSHDALDPGNPPPFRLYNSIVREAPGLPVVMTQDGVDAHCVIAHIGNGLPADSTVLTDGPGFVDADVGDYHLSADSPAIDFCTVTGDVPADDLDGNPRGVDAPQVPPFMPGATYDLGAYEWTAPDDTIFADGFEQATPHGASSPRQAVGE